MKLSFLCIHIRLSHIGYSFSFSRQPMFQILLCLWQSGLNSYMNKNIDFQQNKASSGAEEFKMPLMLTQDGQFYLLVFVKVVREITSITLLINVSRLVLHICL